VGDIQKPSRTGCAKSRYAMISNLLKMSPLPTLVIAGDNDWIDCPDPKLALEYYHSHLDYFHLQWNGTTTAKVITNLSSEVKMSFLENRINKNDEDDRTTTMLHVEHHGKYPEMWRIYLNHVLFISVQNVNYKGRIDDAYNRTLASIHWVRSTIQSNTLSFKAVILFGHGQFADDDDNMKMFFDGIYKAFSNHNLLSTTTVMYIHGDGHEWHLSNNVRRYLNWPMFVDVQVDQGAYADPLFIEFSNSPMSVEHDLQYLLANDTIRMDRQRGRYPLTNGRPNVNGMFPSS
jgi:hypothetical protein